MIEKTHVNIKIGGAAGEGIKVSGLTLARSLTRLGFSVFGYSEYPSLIRGGHNCYQLHVGTDEVFSQVKTVDILLAFNQETILLHQAELSNDSLIIYDSEAFKLPPQKLVGKYLGIPLANLAIATGGKPLMSNMVALGATLTLLKLPTTTLKEIISQIFKAKPKEITLINHQAVDAGVKIIQDQYSQNQISINLPQIKQERILITGNEAMALGAIAGGLQFFAAYPMTPTTNILHYLAEKAKDIGIVVKHSEDEIGAVNMCIGAAFAGTRTMTATSGSGLCLMAEGITLAGISETPLVVVNGMRPGPAAGMPTWTSQGDLKFVIAIGHDDYPKIVLAPGDAQEAFDLTKLALEWAEKWQLPVIILSDKYLAENDYSLIPFVADHQHQRFSLATQLSTKFNFKRYQDINNGISPRTLPGTINGIHCCNSYEHDEYGWATESGAVRTLMMNKRLKKMLLVKKSLPQPTIFGQSQAKTGIISWGSNKSPILEALKTLANVKYLHLNCLWPFPEIAVTDFIKSANKVVCVEGNATGQLANLIREQTGLKVTSLLKYDGRPFYPEEIIDFNI